jgi:hypothetical protein
MTVHTLPPATPVEVVSSDSIMLAGQCQHYAVRTAVQQIVDGAPHLALATLHRSVRRCALLDNRPLSAERVVLRANQLVRSWRDAA